MNAQNEPESQILQLVVRSFLDEYNDLNETWRHLDAKAQATATIAGIFIAGVFAFLTRQGVPVAALQRAILFAGIVFLAVSTLLALLAMRIREISRPPIGSVLSDLVSDLFAEGNLETLADRIPRFLGDQSSLWTFTNEEAYRQNSCKARLIFWAQLMLVLSIGAVSLFTILTVLDP
jgi:hypothetical protein